MGNISELAEGGLWESHARLTSALKKVRPRLRSLCASFRLRQEADDIIQRAALLAVRKGAEVRKMEAWLTGVVWRYCMALARKRAAGSRQEGSGRALAASLPDERRGVSVDLDRLRSVLPEKDWQVLWWIFGEGLTRREVAERRSCSVDSVGTLKRRALRRARGLLAGGRPAKARPERGKSPRAIRRCAVALLHRGGLSLRELAGLNYEDLRLDRAELAIPQGEGAEVIPLPELTVEALRAWCELRGEAPGPLFPSSNVKGRRLTPGGVGLILSRLASGERLAHEALRQPVEVLRAARNQALARLHEEGLGPHRLSRVRVEDVGEEALHVDGMKVCLSDSSKAEVRAWMELLNRGSGFLFVALTGLRPPLTGERIRQILAALGSSPRRRLRRRARMIQKAELPLRLER